MPETIKLWHVAYVYFGIGSILGIYVCWRMQQAMDDNFSYDNPEKEKRRREAARRGERLEAIFGPSLVLLVFVMALVMWPYFLTEVIRKKIRRES